MNLARLFVVAVAHHGSQFAKGHGGARRIQVLAVVAQRPAQEFAPLRHRYRIGSGQRNVAAGQAVGFRQIIQVIVHKMDRHAGQRLFCGFRNIFFQYGVEVQVNLSRLLVIAVAHHSSQFAKGHRSARRIQVLAVVAQRPARQRVPLGHRCRIGSGQRNIAAGQAVGFRQIIQVIVHKMDRHAGQRLFCGFRNIFFQYGVEVQVNLSRLLVIAVAHHSSQFAKGHRSARRIQVLAVVAQRPARQRVPLGHRCRIGRGQHNVAAGQAVGFRQVVQIIIHEMDRHTGQRLFCRFLFGNVCGNAQIAVVSPARFDHGRIGIQLLFRRAADRPAREHIAFVDHQFRQCHRRAIHHSADVCFGIQFAFALTGIKLGALSID